MQERQSPTLHISMLGPWKLKVAGEVVPNSAWKSKKALSVFRYLLAYREHKTHKDTLLNLFWPDDDPEDAMGSLHTTIYFLRRIIQPCREAYQGTSYVRYSNGMYWFEPGESTWIDVDAFLDHYAQGIALESTQPDRALDHYLKGLELYRGDFLVEEAYEDWAESIRNELLQTFINLSLRASHLLARNPGGVSEAVRICRVALTKDPFREELHQAIMTHLIRAGRYGEAAAQYRQVTELLHDEFDLPPSPETRALFHRMQEAEHANALVAAAAEGAEERPYTCDPVVFDAIYTVALRVQKRHGLPIGLITVSVDTNDYDTGQLTAIFEILQRLLRHSDVVSQHGERFKALLLHAGPIGCDIVKRRISRALTRDGLPPVRIDVHVFEVTVELPRAVEPK